MSAYDDYLNGLEQEDTKRNRLTSSLGEAASVNPDEFASMVKLSRAASVSLEALPHYKEEAQQAKLFGEVGLEKLWKDAPKTSEFLSHPDHAKMASDDTANLSGIEGAFNVFKNSGRALAAVIPRMNEGIYGAAAAPFELLGVDSVGGYLRDQQKNSQAWGKHVGPQGAPSGNIESGWYSGITSAGQNLLSLPLAFLPGGQGAALAAMTIPVFGESYGKGRDAGLSPAQSIQFGTQDAAAEYVFERFGLGNLVKNVKSGTGLGKTVSQFLLREVPSEMATTVVQSFDEYANINPGKPVGDWLAQLPDELAQTVVATLVGGSAISASAKAVEKTMQIAGYRQQEAQDAERGAAFIETLNKFIGASTTLQRDPETFEKFITQATENGPVENIYINAQTLQQSGIAEQLAQVSPAIAEQFQAALETGGDIRIPIAEALTKIAPTEYAQSLVDHIRVDENQFSRVEAQEYMQTQGAELQGHIERIMAENEGDATFKASVDAVKENIRSQLDTANRFPSQNNEAFSTLTATFFAVTAARVGMTPEALYAKYPLRVVAESIAGGQKFDQLAKPRTPEFREWFGSSKAKQVVYHATAKDFDAFNTDLSDLGAHFGTEGQANKIAGRMRLSNHEGTQIMPVWLSIKNPLRLKDVGTFHADGIAVQLEKKGLLPKGEGKRIEKEIDKDWKLRKKYDPMLRQIIKDAGYDGVVYANTQEGAGDSFIAFDPTQIKSATGNRGTFDPNDPNILNQSGKISGMADKDTVAGTQAPTSAGDGSTRDARQEFQDRVIAAQDMQDDVRGTGQRLAIDPVGNVILYHGTSISNASEIKSSGKFNDRTFFSASAKETEGHAKPKHKQNTTVIQIAVDPRDIEFSTGSGEFYAPSELVRTEAGTWISVNRLKNEPSASAGSDVLNQFAGQSAATAGTQAPTSAGDGSTGSATIEVDGVLRSTLNSRGKPIAQTEEGLRNFWAWFGDSKVVDADGKPMVVYHGTPADIDAFSKDKLGSSTKATSAKMGFFFTTSEKVATSYAIAYDAPFGSKKEQEKINASIKSKKRIDSAQRELESYGWGDYITANEEERKEIEKELVDRPGARAAAQELKLAEYQSLVAEIEDGANIIPVYLSIKNPIEHDHKGNHYRDQTYAKTLHIASLSGNDGAVIKNTYDSISPKYSEEMTVFVAFDPTQIKSATGNRGTFDPNDANILNQFAGQSAATADTHALATAQQRLKAGDDADVVRKETGWFIGVDGKWRYEIDDSGATLKKPYPENGALWVDVWKSRLMSGDSSTVGKMLDHPALFSAYPALADIAVSAKQGSGASYSARSRQIDIGEDVPMYEVISVLLHEIQHGIQTIEGFATGGNEKTAMLAKLSNSQRLSVALNTVDKIAEKYGYKISENQKSAIAEQVALWEDSDDSVVAKIQGDAGLNDDEIANFFTQDTHEIYRRLAGEVEARNVQSRQALTGEQRRNQSPESTQDVANSDVILVFYGKEMASAPALANAATVKARGSFNPATLQMSLLKSADLSTFLHESAHFFLEVQFDLAAQLQQDANIHGADTLKEGEQEYLRDTQTVLDWFGIKDLAEWNNLDFEEKRSYHERYAESFESYLFTGKAPSIELAPLFQKFRAFLTSVYTSLKNFLAGHPEAGKLTDEVRSVFDRMLATNEQILLAEQARSMMPLFDANDGTITPEEYANLQALGIAGTNEAIQELQAKGLRDLQWARNAKSRELRRLQRDSKSIREELTMQARREIMSHPVYQAWSFLTKKLSRDDMTDLQQTRAKSDPDTVDETQDSLFAAIAKMGGINKRELVETWGIDPADKAQSGVFGKFVMRAEDKGMSIDGMVESLSQYGYLQLDENGKADMRELEEKFKSELAGDTQYSNAYDYSADLEASPIANPKALGAGRLSLAGLSEMDLPPEMINHLKALRMTAKDGLHPDMVAEVVGDFGSGDEMVRAIVAVKPPKEAIAERAQELMLQNHGELATPEAIDLAADKAIHNEVRARAVEAELNALAKATNQREATGNLDKNGKPITRPVLATAAREFAAQMIGRLKVRDIKPSQYANSEAKAARAADKAKKAGDVAQAMAEKRNQLINLYLTKAAYSGQDEAGDIVRYLSKFDREGTRKALANDYLVQIDAILERFDLRKGQSLKAIDKRESLAKFIERQVEAGIEPEIPDWMVLESNKTHYKNLTLDELRAVNESVRQIEHLGRLKNKLLTAKDARELAAIVEEISASMIANHPGEVNNEVRNEIGSKIAHAWRGAMAAHRKAASIVREMDGFKDGGPMWEYFIRPMNEAGDREASMRADAAEKLHALAKPVMDSGKLGGKGKWFQALGRNLNRGEIIAMALNIGNESNLQRLLGGKSWTVGQIKPALDTLTATDWAFVQGVWDFFESYRPSITAKQIRVTGKDLEWIAPGNQFLQMLSAEKGLSLRGGYYPVKYDPRQSGKSAEFDEKRAAQDMMRAANTAATTRRSFAKSRVNEVYDRPLLLTFDGIWQGANEVIHDLTWHEWLIDANRLMRRLDDPMREHYGSEAVNVLRTAIKDSAQGDMPATNAIQRGLNHARIGATVAGLGWNLTTSLLQPIGLTNSVVRIGAPWVARGLREFYSNPLAKAEEVQAKSEFMLNRGRTFMREINDVRNRLESDKGAARSMLESSYFILIQKMQATVDYPTWFGAYLKALDGGNDEARSVSLADQAVIDSQGGGQIKDLAEVQRGHPMMKLFTNFYSFFSVVLNLSVERTKATNFKSPAEVAALAGDYLLLLVLPSAIGAVLKSALKGGDDDEEKLMKKIAEEQIGFLMGLFVGLREMTSFAQMVAGVGNPAFGYSGPAGARLFAEMQKLGQQINQGEADMALFKAANSTAGILFHYPSGQVNRAVEGTAALIDGRTNNPLAPLVGPPPKK